MPWMDVSFPAGARVPARLLHRIDTTLLTHPAPHLTLNGARTPVRSRPPVLLGAPLISSRYLDANGCCGRSPHTRALLTITGQRWAGAALRHRLAAGRRQGPSFCRDQTKNTNWLIFGDPIVAAGSGVVVATLNNLPENTLPTPLAGLNAQNALGNHVIEDLGGGRYAL